MDFRESQCDSCGGRCGCVEEVSCCEWEHLICSGVNYHAPIISTGSRLTAGAFFCNRVDIKVFRDHVFRIDFLLHV